MTSAYSITAAVNPPRAAYVDFPLGHTSGKPDAPHLNRRIVADALRHVAIASRPGEIAVLPYRWSDDDSWKDRVMRPGPPRAEGGPVDSGDERKPRAADPQYQSEADEALAAAAHHAGAACGTCIGAAGCVPWDAPAG